MTNYISAVSKPYSLVSNKEPQHWIVHYRLLITDPTVKELRLVLCTWVPRGSCLSGSKLVLAPGWRLNLCYGTASGEVSGWASRPVPDFMHLALFLQNNLILNTADGAVLVVNVSCYRFVWDTFFFAPATTIPCSDINLLTPLLLHQDACGIAEKERRSSFHFSVCECYICWRCFNASFGKFSF